MNPTIGLLRLLIVAHLAFCARFRSDPEIDEAVKKAVTFILSKRNPNNLEWRSRETAAAILGLTSGDPLWRMNENHVDITKIEVKQSVTALKLALSEIINRHEGSLKDLDDSTLAQFISALQISCVNQTDVFGINLLAESQRRLDKTLQRSPSLAGLTLPLCNAGLEIPLEQIEKLSLPRRGQTALCRSLCIEKVALNILSLTCLFRDKEFYDFSTKSLIFEKIKENVDYLRARKIDEKDLSLFETALLLQAKDVSPVKLPIDDVSLFEKLLSYQSPDGSFANSVTLTAVAIPSLSHFNALDIQSLACQNQAEKNVFGNGWAVYGYEIHDLNLHTQSLFGEFNDTGPGLRPEDTVLSLIYKFQKEFPYAFRFQVESNAFGTVIESLVGIPTSPVSVWNVYIKDDKGQEQLIRDLEKTEMKAGNTLVFKYENN